MVNLDFMLTWIVVHLAIKILLKDPDSTCTVSLVSNLQIYLECQSTVSHLTDCTSSPCQILVMQPVSPAQILIIPTTHCSSPDAL